MEGVEASLHNLSLQVRLSATTSPLMDKIPVEIRLQIFRAVWRSDSKVVKPISPSTYSEAQRIDTALFAVSRQISREAQDAFFGLHKVIVTDLDTKHSSISLFRHIEIRPDLTFPLWPTRIFRACSPKLKTFVLARENLSRSLTLRGFLQRHRLGFGNRLRCLELGVLEVEPDNGVGRRIFVKDFGMAHHLPESRSLCSQWSLTGLHNRVSQAQNRRILTDADQHKSIQAQLALWLAAYETYKSHGYSLDQLRGTEKAIVSQWRGASFSHTTRERHMHQGLPHDVKLQDLNVAEHGAEVVEWATEVIGDHLQAIMNLVRRKRG